MPKCVGNYKPEWAVSALTDRPVDDMDGGPDSRRGYRSLFHGAPPIVQNFEAPADECDFLIGEISTLLDLDVASETICLVARFHWQLEDYMRTMETAGIEHLFLEADTRDDEGPGVRLATMHRVKGLEFAHVLIAGANDGVLPSPNAGEAEEIIQERCLLHVAASRARDTLTITSHRTPSPFITELEG